MASPTFITSLVFIYILTGVIYYLPKSSHDNRNDDSDYTISRCRQPEQIHLSVTGKPSERVITFVVQTSSCPEQGQIKYGMSPNHLNQLAQVKCNQFDAGNGRMLSILYSKVTTHLFRYTSTYSFFKLSSQRLKPSNVHR